MKRVVLGAGLVIASLTGHASAQAVGPWYFGQPYLRGDVGGAFSTNSSFRDVNPSASSALLGPGGRFKGNLGNSAFFDIGAGARLLPYWRWDATLTYIPSLKFSGGDTLGHGSAESANVDSLVGMLNGYLDLAGLAPYAFGMFQPYLDAGVGAASNHLATMDSSFGTGTIAGDTRTSFAWGMGAGVGYPIAPNTTLDVAYKYLDLGEMRTGTTDGAGAAITPLKADLHTHTVTMGLRFGF